MADLYVIVADAASTTTGDDVIVALLEARGHRTTLVTDTATPKTDKDGVVISESCSSGNVGNDYGPYTNPVLLLEPSAADDMFFVAAAPGYSQEFDHDLFIEGLRTGGLQIADEPHLMTNMTGLNGFGWWSQANVTSDAELVAYISDANWRVTAFTIEKGANLETGTAAGKRAHWGCRDPSMADLTTAGERFFNGLVDYCWPPLVGQELYFPNHFNSQRQTILNNLISNKHEATGWNELVRSIPVSNVVRTSDTEVTITLPAIPTFDITELETVTARVENSCLKVKV